MGNPSNAVTSTSYPTNYLLVKSQYAVSYNNNTRIPNWVSWQLNSSWLGSTPGKTISELIQLYPAPSTECRGVITLAVALIVVT